jgi:hypothetical protein
VPDNLWPVKFQFEPRMEVVRPRKGESNNEGEGKEGLV